MIDYFDFLKQYPHIIDMKEFGYIDTNIVNQVQEMNKDVLRDKPILEIDFTRLSDLVLDDKINNRDTILTKNIVVGLMDDVLFYIKQTDELTIREINNKNEKKGNFHIQVCKHQGYRNLKEIEIDSIKRTVLIDKILENGESS